MPEKERSKVPPSGQTFSNFPGKTSGACMARAWASNSDPPLFVKQTDLCLCMMDAREETVEEAKLKWKNNVLPVFLPQALLGILISTGVLYGGYYHCDCIPVPKSGGFQDKLVYYIRSCVFPSAVVLLLTIMNVANKRGGVGAANPLAGREHFIQVEKNILMNTMEQMLLFLTVSLALITYLDAAEMNKLLCTPFSG